MRQLWYSVIMRSNSRRLPSLFPALLVGTSVAAWSASAVAEEAGSGVERVFWTGPTSGEPADGKRAVLIGLYTVSVVGAGATGYWAYSWLDSREEERKIDTEGACYDLVSATCRTLLEAQGRTRSFERLTAAGAAATAAFVVSGMLVAHYWENGSFQFDIGASAIAARLQARF